MSTAVAPSNPLERHDDCASPRDPARGAVPVDASTSSRMSQAVCSNATANRVHLVDQTNPAARTTIAIDTAEFFIGRDPSCQLCLASPFVSRTHAVIEHRDGGLFIHDLLSRNGTLLNGRLFRGESVVLAHGDQLEIGFSRFTIAIQEAPAESTPLNEVTIANWLNQGKGSPPPVAPSAPAAAEESPATTAEAPAVPPHLAHLACQVAGDVLIITLLSPRLDGEPSVSPIRNELFLLLDRQLPRHQVIDLAQVEYLSDRAAGTLLAYAQRVQQRGGLTRMRGLPADAGSVHVLDRLSLLYEIFPNGSEAVAAPW